MSINMIDCNPYLPTGCERGFGTKVQSVVLPLVGSLLGQSNRVLEASSLYVLSTVCVEVEFDL